MSGKYGLPLITQNTDLKSLKYTTTTSTDKTIGKAPYVTKNVPKHSFEKDSTGLISGTFESTPTPEASSIIGSRIDDLKRLATVIKEKGVKFSINQALLGNSPKEIALIIGATLAQAPVNGTGTHFTHGFVKDTYLKNDISSKTGFGRFLAETLGINNLLGSSRALTGKTIIPDNDGQKSYRPQHESALEKLNSKYDLKPGADNFSSTLLDKLRVNPYIDTLARAVESPIGQKIIGAAGNLLKGITSTNKKKKLKDPLKKVDLGSIFKIKGDNLGQENFQPMTPTGLITDEEAEMHDSIQSELKGPKDPVNHLTTGNADGTDIEGRPLIRGGAKKVIVDNDGGRGYEPQAFDFLKNKESEQTINIEGEEKPLRPTITTGSMLLEKPGSDAGLPIIPDSRGEEGFNNDRYATLPSGSDISPDQLNIDIPSSSYAGLDARTLIKGTPEEKNTKIVADFSSSIKYKASEENIEVNGELQPLRPTHTLTTGSAPGYKTPEELPDYLGTNNDGYNRLNHHSASLDKATTVLKATPFSAGVNPQGPSTTGRIMPQIGPDGIAEGEFRTFVDEEGGVTGVIERKYNPNNPSQLKMYLQDQLIPESEDLKTELGGTVSAGSTSTKRVTKLIDFRKVRKYGVNAGVKGKGESIGPDTNGYSSNTPKELLADYTTQEVGVRLGYAKKGVGDYINMSEVIEVSNTDAAAVAEEATWKYYNGDIIPFTFNTLTPDGQKFIFFRAFLDDMSDSFTGDWTGTQYVGRAEEFYTYQGFKRDVSFSFKVAAFSKQELLPLYKKLNHLVASTAPTYSKAGNFMRGTLTTLSIGEYFDRQDGFISKVDLSWEKGYPWEIDLLDENIPQVPTILNVSVSFTPIHDFEVKNDIDLSANESYFGAQYGKPREKVGTASTLPPRPTIQPRPQAEVITPPAPSEVIAPPTPTPVAPANIPAIQTPTAQTATVNPTLDIQAAGGVNQDSAIQNNVKSSVPNNKATTNIKELTKKRKTNITPTAPPKYSALVVYTDTSTGKKATGRHISGRSSSDALEKAKTNAIKQLTN